MQDTLVLRSALSGNMAYFNIPLDQGTTRCIER